MDHKPLWDAIVVGAGPAGAVAARQLALQGKEVLLVEKARLPRDKVCGGCLGGAALEALSSIGLENLPKQCGGVQLTDFVLASEGAIARVPVGLRIAISRRTFDQALVREAARAGVVVQDGVRAEFFAASGDLAAVNLWRNSDCALARAKVLIVATGIGDYPPGVALRFARHSRIGLSALVDQPPCEGTCNTLSMAVTGDGYVGITEVDGNRFDVAAAVDPRALATARAPGQLIERIMEAAGLNPCIDLQQAHWLGTPRLTRRATPLSSHRCLLIGDAARYVEPFTGEGIGWAIQSAILAASLLSGPLDWWDSSLSGRWQSLYDEAFAGRQRQCYAVSRALRISPLRRFATRCLHWAPSLARPMVARLDRPFCKI